MQHTAVNAVNLLQCNSIHRLENIKTLLELHHLCRWAKHFFADTGDDGSIRIRAK